MVVALFWTWICPFFGATKSIWNYVVHKASCQSTCRTQRVCLTHAWLQQMRNRPSFLAPCWGGDRLFVGRTVVMVIGQRVLWISPVDCSIQVGPRTRFEEQQKHIPISIGEVVECTPQVATDACRALWHTICTTRSHQAHAMVCVCWLHTKPP